MTGCKFAVAQASTVVVEDRAVFVRLLSRIAVGSPMTQYSSHFCGPRQGGEMHIVRVARRVMSSTWASETRKRCRS
jgi:L-lactate dehydrogenase complex protein LldF